MKEFSLVVLSFVGLLTFIFLVVKALDWFNRQNDRTQIQFAACMLVIIVDLCALILLCG